MSDWAVRGPSFVRPIGLRLPRRPRLGSLFLAAALAAGPVQAAILSPAVHHPGSLELVFLDPSVPAAESLLADLLAQAAAGRRLEVVTLDASRDGIGQVTEALAGHVQVDAIHFITHGTDAAVQLGDSWLNATTVAAHAVAVAGWGHSLKADGDLLFYGCDFASSARGRALLDWMAELTQADVAASTDKTGALSLGSNWTLEYQAGSVEAAIAVSARGQRAWNHRLFTVINTNNAGAGSLRDAITLANGNGAGFDLIDFNIPPGGAQTINLNAALPNITGRSTIDGTTQPGWAPAPIIQLNGGGLR